MKYLGSKRRIAKHILPIMLKEAEQKGITTWVEPFVGGGNMIDKVPSTFTRIGIDINIHTIAALIAIRDFVHLLPDSLSESEYKQLIGKPPEPISSWLRFVASFGGKFDNGYAREKGSNDSTFIQYAKRNAIKQSPNLKGVQLLHGSYDEYSHFENCVIYCDPPYEGTTSYKTNAFNHEKFWEWCRYMAKQNLMFISEYNAPEDYVCIWQGETKVNFSSQRKQATNIAIEKLFTLNQ